MRRQDSVAQRLRQERVLRDLIQPLQAGSQDFGVGGVAEVARVDARRFGGVGRGDVHTAAGERVLEADEQRDAVLAVWWLAEEFGLIAAGAHIELAGDAEGLQVRELRVGELVYDELWSESVVLTPEEWIVVAYFFLRFLELRLRQRILFDLGDGGV